MVKDVLVAVRDSMMNAAELMNPTILHSIKVIGVDLSYHSKTFHFIYSLSLYKYNPLNYTSVIFGKSKSQLFRSS